MTGSYISIFYCKFQVAKHRVFLLKLDQSRYLIPLGFIVDLVGMLTFLI